MNKPASKTGRNDPCPCGSGRKYKRCCLANERTDESLWQRQNRLHELLPARLLKFALTTFGEDVLEEAWDAFVLWDEDAPGFDPESPDMPVFMPWFFYDWTPDPAESSAPNAALRGMSPATMYLQRRSSRLEPLERRCLQASLDACFSFHEIVSVRPGEGFTLRDLLSGQESEVTEHSASQSAAVGDTLFARVVTLDSTLVVLDGCGPFIIPAEQKPLIIELRRYIDPAAERVTPDMLRDIDIEMLEVYHVIAADLRSPRMPALVNTDGEDFRFYEIVFDIDTPQAAYDALAELGPDGEPEIAEYDSDGALYSVEIPWLRPDDAQHNNDVHTVLGVLRIEGDQLTVEVNSENRSQEIRELVEQRLGAQARYRTTASRSAETAMAEAQDLDAMDDDDPANDPELRQALTDILTAHYDDWPCQSLPALDGATPEEAVRNPAGREKVAALLAGIERRLAQDQPWLVAIVMPRLRAALGL